jgi:hypothetical protein
MKLKLIFALALIVFCAGKSFATAQYPDKIFYNGKEYLLHTNPLEKYFNQFPEKRPKNGLVSTALWRGYVATFEIKDGGLFLKDIEILVRKKNSDEKSFETEWKSVLSEVFPDKEKLKLDWFTGLLVLPHGKLVQYVHMGYASTYENYILLEISDGEFKRALEFDHKKYTAFKERQFEAFKKTDEYRKLFEEMSKDKSSSPAMIESFLKNFVIDYSSKILVD